MRILYVSSTVNPSSGWGRVTYSLATEVSHQEHDVGILLPQNQEKTRIKNIRLFYALSDHLTAVYNPSTLFKNQRAIQMIAGNFDLVHFLVEEPYPIANIFGLPKPYCLTVYGSYAISSLHGNILERLLFQKVLEKSAMVFAISNFTKKELIKAGFRKEITVIPVGVDLAIFKKVPVKKNPREIRILSVGGLTQRKGYQISLPAVAQLKKKFKKRTHYVIVSGNRNWGKYQDYINNLIKKNDLTGNVEIKSNLSDAELVRQYNLADVFLLTPVKINNAFEGFGLVYLEAAACELPSVASNSGGVSDAISYGKSGLLVPENDVSSAAQALIEILANSKMRQTMSQFCRKWSHQFSWKIIAREYIDSYIKIVGRQ